MGHRSAGPRTSPPPPPPHTRHTPPVPAEQEEEGRKEEITFGFLSLPFDRFADHGSSVSAERSRFLVIFLHRRGRRQMMSRRVGVPRGDAGEDEGE